MKKKYALDFKKVYGVSVIDKLGCVTNIIYLYGKTKSEVKNFIKHCNKQKLEPALLKDAISDIFYSK